MTSNFRVRFLKPLFFSIAGALLALFLFEQLADEILEGEKLQADSVLRSAIHAFASPGTTEVMRLFSDIGNVSVVLALSFAACMALWFCHRRAASFLIAAAVGGAGILMWALKLLFHRPRPEPYFGIAIPSDYSFPSGHALVAFCFYGVVATIVSSELKTRGAQVATWVVAAAMAFAIGLSRVYLGVHYPSDVIGGYLAGAVWISGVAIVYRRLRGM